MSQVMSWVMRERCHVMRCVKIYKLYHEEQMLSRDTGRITRDAVQVCRVTRCIEGVDHGKDIYKNAMKIPQGVWRVGECFTCCSHLKGRVFVVAEVSHWHEGPAAFRSCIVPAHGVRDLNYSDQNN